MDERLVQFDEKMQKTMNNLSEEFGSIRAGRANPHVLDKLRVDYYGTPTPIQQVANVNVPEPRMIQIQPWEASMVKEIEKVIMTSDLGINPTNDGKTIRLLFPELTEERRKDLAKDVKKKGESAKVAIRNIRRDANDSFKKLAKEDVSEDGNALTLKVILVQAVATSIDAFAVGVSLRAVSVAVAPAVSIIGVTTLLCCIVALAIGKRFGHLLGDRAQIVGGVVLVLIGIKAMF